MRQQRSDSAQLAVQSSGVAQQAQVCTEERNGRTSLHQLSIQTGKVGEGGGRKESLNWRDAKRKGMQSTKALGEPHCELYGEGTRTAGPLPAGTHAAGSQQAARNQQQGCLCACF